MEPIENLGLISTLNAINPLINSLGFKHLKSPKFKTLNSDLQKS